MNRAIGIICLLVSGSTSGYAIYKHYSSQKDDLDHQPVHSSISAETPSNSDTTLSAEDEYKVDRLLAKTTDYERDKLWLSMPLSDNRPHVEEARRILMLADKRLKKIQKEENNAKSDAVVNELKDITK